MTDPAELDMAESYAIMNREKKERHAEWHQTNTRLLEKSGIPFRVASRETYLFREPGKPKVDFYPSTGRWRVAGVAQTFKGGAKSFINWYRNQSEKR